MILRKSYKPTFRCNATNMLEELAKAMSPEQKRAWAATLDLQEPVVGLMRYMVGFGNGGSLQGQIEGVSTIGWLIRHGDRDFIEGALSGPRAKETQVYLQGHYFGNRNDGVDRSALREALGMADVETLRKVDEVWGGIDNHFIHTIHLGLRLEFGSAIYCLAHHADSHSQKDVADCVGWILENHDRFADTMYVIPAKESAKSKAERLGSQARLKADARDSLLMAACDAGSEKLAKPLVDAGAVPSWPTVVRALSKGAPALAEALWKGVLAKPNPTKADGEWDSLESSIKSNGSNEATALDAVVSSLDRLDISLSKRVHNENDWDKPLYEGKKKDLTSFIMFAISAESQKEKSDLVSEARAALAGKALVLSTWLENPAAIVRKVRADYPVPTAWELSSLAKKNKRSLVKSRLDDAVKAGVSKAWIDALAQTCARCVGESLKDADGRGSYGSDVVKSADPLGLWGVKFLMDCSLHPMGWTFGKTPLDELKNYGILSKDVCAKIHSAIEASLLDALAEKATPDIKGNLRI